ncbi:MAG: hypothetical protein HC806_04265 [Anaerolineae bacterium]|nr:hypothetical protein [Anaerolineae bacterium]
MKTTNRMPFLWMGTFILALGLMAIVTFSGMRELVATWDLPGFQMTPFSPEYIAPTPTEPVNLPYPVYNPTQPLQPFNNPPTLFWDGDRRVTILLLGLDAREGEESVAPPRTDTIMLMTFDPETNAVKLLSLRGICG